MGSLLSTPVCPTDCSNDRVADFLFSSLYSELHRLAKRELSRRWSFGAMSVTTLLHEAYVEIAARTHASFPGHAHFMGYATRVMRGLIIDHVRNHRAAKRGGELVITSSDMDQVGEPPDSKELCLISDALDQLAKVEPDLAQVVDLKFFCGFS